ITVEIAGHAIDLGTERGTMIIARDVTERNRIKAQLIQGDRLAQVGTLAAGMAHEINNPLAYVIGNLTAVGEALPSLVGDTAEGADLIEAMAEARVGAERIAHIVRDMKSFSRADEERLTAVNLHAVLDSTVNMAKSEIKHRAQLVKCYAPDLPPVNAN